MRSRWTVIIFLICFTRVCAVEDGERRALLAQAGRFSASLEGEGCRVRFRQIGRERSVPPQEACSLNEFTKQWTEQMDGGHPSNSTMLSVEFLAVFFLLLSPDLFFFPPLTFLHYSSSIHLTYCRACVCLQTSLNSHSLLNTAWSYSPLLMALPSKSRLFFLSLSLYCL